MTPHLIAFTSLSAPVQRSGQDIGQTIRDAVEQATREAQQEARNAQREAQQQVRDAQQRVRDAQQEIRDAQQQMREARTNDQRGAANQAMAGAQQSLREAEEALRAVQQQTRDVPFVYTGQPPNDRPVIPGEAVDIAIGFFVTCAVIIVGWPIARALGRRFERRGAQPALESGMSEQLQRIEQSVEAIAIEVERISESQRFLAKLQDKSA
jgi:cation transport ATPase